jgi:predicted ATPase/DNA-binding SARP family transcriptional activator
MTQTTRLRIYLLGPMRIERDAVRIHLPRRKVESLLAYLLLHPEQHVRDHLATLFWGDSFDTQARQSLRTALASVRRLVGPDLLLTDRDHVQLNDAFPLWVDLHQLLDLENTPDHPNRDFLQANLALWQGDLLAGFYDEWITLEREYYRTRLLKLFLQVTQSLRARSEYAQAIAVAQRVLTHDLANEHAHQHLMFCYVAAGDRPAALRQYELCVRALQEDLDAPPLPETTALYQWIKQSDGDEPAPAGKITNLPLPLTSFVGRTRETAEVKRLLSLSPTHPSQPQADRNRGVRLLTLTGAGGSGKTRLAIQVATDLIDSFAHGVWWVELAALTDGGLVGRAVAKTLGVNEVMEQTVSHSVANYVGDKQLLLVLDNCEHLIEPCAQVVADLLGRCPHLQILATSREPLNLAGETLWQVPTFAAPDPSKLALVDWLLHFESVRLFVERAAAVQPGFALTPTNAQAVAEICQRLDGIPLAIELAAARVKVLTVEQIAGYLTGALGARFALLTQGSRVALPRHQTLRATIDWSYDLLDEAERLLFRQAAVFRGGFTLEALEQIVGSGSNGRLPSPPTTLDLLTQLVDKSLVMVEPQGGQNRYRLLETLREYALERFPTPEEMKRYHQQHAEVFLRLAEQSEPELMGAQQHSWLNRLEAEHANLRAALDYLIPDADGERALRLAAALYRFWEVRGYASEGREWLQKALAHRDAATYHTQAKALHAAGTLAWRQSDFDQARQVLEESIFFFEQCEEEAGMVEALQSLAAVNMSQGEYSVAQLRLEQSLTMCRSLNYDYGIARALNYLGNLAVDQDRYTAAREYYLESLRLYQTLGDQVSMAIGFFNVGNTARQMSDFDTARTNYEACLTISRAVGHKGLIGVSLRNLGVVAFDQQAYAQANSYSEEALSILRELGDKSNMAFALSTLGNVAHELGEHQRALMYYCQKLQLLFEVGHKWGTFYALEEIARLFTELGKQTEWAARLFAAAHVLRQEADLPVPVPEQTEYEGRLTSLRQLLGDVAFNTLWDEGQTTPLAQIVAKATMLSLS